MPPNTERPSPPAADRPRVIKAEGPPLGRVPSAAWLQTVDVTTAIAHLPCARWFLSVLVASELLDDLRGPGPWTVLVPIDAALGGRADAELEEIFDPEEAEALIDVGEHHVARGVIRVGAQEAAAVTTLGGAERRIGAAEAGLAGVAGVVRGNLRCRNGLLHLIEDLVLPPWLEARRREGPPPEGLDAA